MTYITNSYSKKNVSIYRKGEKMRIFVAVAFLLLLVAPSAIVAEVEILKTENASLTFGQHDMAKKNFVYVREEGRLYELANDVSAVGVITDSETIKLFASVKRDADVFNHAADPYLTGVRAMMLHDDVFQGINRQVNTKNIVKMRSVRSDDISHDAIVKIGKQVWGISGSNIRFFVNGQGSTLGNFVIHYEDIPRFLNLLCLRGTTVNPGSQHYRVSFKGQLHKALKVMEFLHLLYQGKRYGKGDFEGTSKWLEANSVSSSQNEDRKTWEDGRVHWHEHHWWSSMAIYFAAAAELQYVRSGETNFPRMYYPLHYLNIVEGSRTYKSQPLYASIIGAHRQDTEEGLAQRLQSKHNMTDWGRRRRVILLNDSWRSIGGSSRIKLWEKQGMSGSGMHAPPISSFSSEFEEELSHWPDYGVQPDGKKLVTWGSLKRQ